MVADLITRAVRRRWRLAAITIVSGLFVTILLKPAWGIHDYEATHTLYSPAAGRAAGSGAGLVDPFLLKPDAIAALATSRQTAIAAAAKLGYDGNPLKLVEHLRARADEKAGTVSITDKRTNPQNAVAVANAVGESLVALVDQSRAAARARALDDAETRVDGIQHELAGLDTKDSSTKQRRDQLTQELNTAAAQVDQLTNAPPTSGIATIRPAVAKRVSSGALRSLPPVVGWLLTLLPLAALGLGVAVAAEFADDTIGEASEADAVMGLPVLAVVPRGGDDAELTRPPPEAVARAIAELRQAVVATAHARGGPEQSFVVPKVAGAGRVVLFAAAGAHEDTTKTVVHFAASVAETGRSALIVDCDDGNGSGVGADGGGTGGGIGELAANGIVPTSLQSLVQPTALARVSLVPRGAGADIAGWLVRHRELVDRSRDMADVVILHGPSVVGGGDGAALAALADHTIVVCTSGSTRTADARRAGEQLRAANVSAAVALVGAAGPAAPLPTPAELWEKVRSDPRTRGRAEWAGAAVAMLLLFVFLRAFVFESFSIPTPSMSPYLDPGDRVLVSKISYHLHDIHRGDVIVFDAPKGATALQGERLIKRVIGLPGETVESRDGHIFINGQQQPEKYLPKGTITNGVKKLRLPSGRYWVMGDNRPNSADSRFFGSIAKGTIIGRAFFHIWPWPVGFM